MKRRIVLSGAVVSVALALPVATTIGTAGVSSAAGGASTNPPPKPSPPPSTSQTACSSKPAWTPTSTGNQPPAVQTEMGAGSSIFQAPNYSNLLAFAYQQFNTNKCTVYSHSYSFQPTVPFYGYDCVGFTFYTLRNAYPVANQEAAKAMGLGPSETPTPQAAEQFFNSVVANPAKYPDWGAVPTVNAITPGDMVAWWYGGAGGNGHSVIPLVAPQAIPGSNNTKWEVVIMDSTTYNLPPNPPGHGPDDTRNPSTSNPNYPSYLRNNYFLNKYNQWAPSGLGIGTVVFDTDASLHVTGIQWSTSGKVEPVTFGAANPAGPTPTPTPPPPPPGPAPIINPTPLVSAGYDLVAGDGGVFSFGDAPFSGSLGGLRLNAPIVSGAVSPDGSGYWLAGADGGVFTLSSPNASSSAFGSTFFYGSMGGQPLNAPIVKILPTSDGGGYWLVGADGGVYSFGDAAFYGSMGGRPLNAPIVGAAATPEGGYWLVGADGGVYSFGDAGFNGSMGGQPINAPIVAAAATSDGAGYWLVGADGGVYSFGDAVFVGSMGGQSLNAPIVAIAS